MVITHPRFEQINGGFKLLPDEREEKFKFIMLKTIPSLSLGSGRVGIFDIPFGIGINEGFVTLFRVDLENGVFMMGEIKEYFDKNMDVENIVNVIGGQVLTNFPLLKK